MAVEETKSGPDAAEPRPSAAPAAMGRMMPTLIVALLIGAEGIGVFFLAKAVGSNPVTAVAAGAEEDEQEPGNSGTGLSRPQQDELVEIELAECRPNNMMVGKLITFHLRVSALVSSDDLERIERMARSKRAQLEDGVNTVIRSAELKHLKEPELGTIKRRLKHEFDQIFGDDQLIKRVLIPQLLQSVAGV